MKRLILLSLCMMFALLAYAKNAGDLLSKYLDNPMNKDHETLILGFVEIESIEYDDPPKEGSSLSGTLNLKKVEAVGAILVLPKEFTVRFRKTNDEQVIDTPLSWNRVSLEKGKKLLGFFNHWGSDWAVQEYGYTNIISNPENIESKLLARAQKLFKSKLVPEKKE